MSARAKVAVLVGAGASTDAGLAVTLQMTEMIIEGTYVEEHRQLLRYLQRTLEANAALPKSRRRIDVREPIPRSDGLDVERLFAAVDLLIARELQPWSPFVAAWDSGLESFGVEEFADSRRLDELLTVLDQRYLKHDTVFTRVGDRLQSYVRAEIRSSRPDVTGLLWEIHAEMLAQLGPMLRIP